MEYDYVVVGAGSAGATLAARLSQDPSLQVALVEAGLDYRSADAPLAMRQPNPSQIVGGPEFEHFRYPKLMSRRTKVQERRQYWRGRGMGGSSAINGQIAIRGVVEDYDGWAAQGCTGWSYKDVLPYFNRLETDLRYGDKPYHGDQGPIPIYRAPVTKWGAVDQALAEGALNLGYPWAEDHNAPHALGVSPYAINNRDSQRVSTNDGYLEPARGRNNLSIMGDTVVDSVVFEGSRAVGVRLIGPAGASVLRGREIILSAGAVHSPTILMRSGVGPAEQLRSLDIPVLTDLPVGQSFQDHPLAMLIVYLDPDASSAAGFRHTNCCTRYSSELWGASAGDMLFVALNRVGDSLGQGQAPEAAPSFGMLGVWVNQCESLGELRLASRDPMVDPTIEENMLDAESDIVRMRDGIRRLIDISRQDAVSAIGKVDLMGLSPSSSDADIDAWAQAIAGDTQHATSTCRMGAETDPRTVVDSDCRVLGLDGLRVIDASVMPNVVRANTNLTTIMIAETMAERMRDGDTSRSG